MLPREVVDQLLSTPDGLRLGGERRLITVLTSDLRGFTSLAERLSAEDIIRILNYYLGCMADVIISYAGTVNLFLGDGILAYFGAPIPSQDHARKALACALAMQAKMPEVNRVLSEWGYPRLEMGVGINTGEVIIGNVGSEQRAQYGAVGRSVNLAFRIESYSSGGDILASDATLDAAGPGVDVSDSSTIFPKGSRGPLTIYSVKGLAESPELSMDSLQDAQFPLGSPCAVSFAEIHEKEVSLIYSDGAIHRLGLRTASILLTSSGRAIPARFTNLRIVVAGQGEAYGKVKSSDTAADGTFLVQFTQQSPEVESWIKEMLSAHQMPNG